VVSTGGGGVTGPILGNQLTVSISSTTNYNQTVQANQTGAMMPAPLALPVGCRLILTRPTRNTPGETTSPLETLTFTEQTTAGFTTTSRSFRASTSTTTTGGATTTTDFNFFHGAVVEYTNTAVSQGCTFTQGFFKNRGQRTGEVTRRLALTSAFTTTVDGQRVLIVADANGAAAGFDRALTAAQIDEILETPTRGSAELILLHQLITAELNVVGGAMAPMQIQTDIARAQVLLVGGISAGERAEAIAIAERLDQFNNGDFPGGPGHCDDENDD
jgi:hypothetical protein